MHLNNVPGGYERLQIFQIGSGATEIIWSIVQSLNQQEFKTIDGSIEAVFDRTVHISLPTDLGSQQTSLIVLGKENVRTGPLLMQVQTPTDFSFNKRLAGVSKGVDIKQISSGSNLQINMGAGLNVSIDTSKMSLLPAGGGIYEQLNIEEFQYGADLVTLNVRLIEYLDDQGLEDGLDLLTELVQYHTIKPSPFLDSLVSSINSILTAKSFDPDDGNITNRDFSQQPIIELLGCGPGATPSGDDILLGIFLILQRIADRRISKRAELLCKKVSKHASSMTTRMSSSLLEEVSKKRVAKPAKECSLILTDPTSSQKELIRAAEDLIETGHTSGLDSLIGMLIATTIILPEVKSTL